MSDQQERRRYWQERLGHPDFPPDLLQEMLDRRTIILEPVEDTQEVNGWTVDNRGRVVDGPFGEKPPLGSDETPCPGCGQPMGYHAAEGFCL